MEATTRSNPSHNKSAAYGRRPRCRHRRYRRLNKEYFFSSKWFSNKVMFLFLRYMLRYTFEINQDALNSKEKFDLIKIKS